MANIESFRNINTFNNLQRQKHSPARKVSFGMKPDTAYRIVEELSEHMKQANHLEIYENPHFSLVKMINKGKENVSERLKYAVQVLIEQLSSSFTKTDSGLCETASKTKAEETIGKAIKEFQSPDTSRDKVRSYFARIRDTEKYPDLTSF